MASNDPLASILPPRRWVDPEVLAVEREAHAVEREARALERESGGWPFPGPGPFPFEPSAADLVIGAERLAQLCSVLLQQAVRDASREAALNQISGQIDSLVKDIRRQLATSSDESPQTQPPPPQSQPLPPRSPRPPQG